MAHRHPLTAEMARLRQPANLSEQMEDGAERSPWAEEDGAYLECIDGSKVGGK